MKDRPLLGSGPHGLQFDLILRVAAQAVSG
jgi:hypothetical protein